MYQFYNLEVLLVKSAHTHTHTHTHTHIYMYTYMNCLKADLDEKGVQTHTDAVLHISKFNKLVCNQCD